MRRIRRSTKALVAAVVAAASTFALAAPAAACGFLVAENGAVRLGRTTTLAAWAEGVEHYVTSFEFASDQPSFGSIVPLPAEPTVVERAGDWTLQRLQREVAPPIATARGDVALATSSAEVEVLREVEIDSLDVTILRGGGADVAEWARTNGFDLDGGVDEVLDSYAEGSPYFMAARFDAERAEGDEFSSGDGIPVHLEMPLERPWVPLRILAAAKPAAEVVRADVFLLTPEEVAFRDLPRGVDVARSERASQQLLEDLRSDESSAWVPTEAWLTYVTVATPAGQLDGDLVVRGDRAEHAAGPGGEVALGRPVTGEADGADASLVAVWVLLLGAGAVVVALGLASLRSARPHR